MAGRTILKMSLFLALLLLATLCIEAQCPPGECEFCKPQGTCNCAPCKPSMLGVDHGSVDQEEPRQCDVSNDCEHRCFPCREFYCSNNGICVCFGSGC